MAETKHGLDDVNNVRDVLLARLFIQTGPRRTGLRSKAERLVDGKRREVHVVLWAVLHVAAIPFFNVFGAEGIIPHVAVDGMELPALVCEGLEERATP